MWEFHDFHFNIVRRMLEILFLCLLAIYISFSGIVYHNIFAYYSANQSTFFL